MLGDEGGPRLHGDCEHSRLRAAPCSAREEEKWSSFEAFGLYRKLPNRSAHRFGHPLGIVHRQMRPDRQAQDALRQSFGDG